MKRLIPIVLVLIMTTTAFAQGHGRAVMPTRPDFSGNIVGGTVSSVSGSTIFIAGGLISIDTTGAKFTGVDSIAGIAPGALVTAVLKPGDVAPNAPLPAAVVIVTRIPQASLTGTVSSVDLAAKTFLILGRTIKVTAQTIFDGPISIRPLTLSDLFAGQFVSVEANVSGDALTATAVHIITPMRIPDPNEMRLTGFVKSIGATQWTIGLGPAGSLAPDFLVLVNADTKITGDPKVGDRVTVIGKLTSNGLAASSITKVQ
jgi:hypothetical protein